VVKNPTSGPVPPKTLNEAGQFAVCFSAAWDSKVLTAAYWVTPDQVSKTAPSGEYLTVGSFMIRGKKNFLPPSHLIMGFGFMFKLEDDSVERHKGDRKIRGLEETIEVEKSEVDSVVESLEDVEIDVEDGESSEDEKEEVKLESIDEQETENENNDKNISEPNTEKESTESVKEQENDDTEEETGEENVDEPVSEFPDTDVRVGFDRLGSVEIKTRSVSVSEDPEPVVEPVRTKPIKKEKKKVGGTNNQKEIKQEEPKKSDNVRGKKGKLKKIKEKYKDQDEEERELRMQILQSQGKEKNNKNNKKNKRGMEQLYGKSKATAPKEKRPPPKPKTEIIDGEEVLVEEEKVAVNDETDMLDSLTGVPVAEDELLFAVPVCAPYNTLLNYKYKVKLTPGTGKRGKSCKTALAMFLADKATIPREKDLLKSVKDQDLARNLPGKVKLSAPHLQKVKGKK